MGSWRLLIIAPLAMLIVACSDGFDIKGVDRSVVRVQHLFEYQGRQLLGGHGTGFVLNDEGYVVTNHHVIDLTGKLQEGLKPIEIFVPDGSWEKRLTARVVWSSQAYDLAILHVPGLQRPAVTLANVKPEVAPEKGESVYALGYPGAGDSAGRTAALESTFTSGKVSRVSLGQGTKEGAERMIVQHTANINPGNSGGPLFNECNRVVAVNTFAATSVFKVSRDAQGQFVAHGAAISGVYYSPHVSSLIAQLTTVPELRNVRFRSSSDACVPSSGTPVILYVAIVLVMFLALASMVLALVRKRGPREVIKVVETYSQWIRRRGDSPGAGAGGGPVAGAATKQPRPRTAPSAAPPPELDEGWLLSGFDGEGKVVRLAIGKTELARATDGADKGLIIGRSNSLSNKVLGDGSVSRRHARLVPMESGLGIEDLNSTYGSTVNGEALKPYTVVPVEAGARITLGDVKLDLSKA